MLIFSRQALDATIAHLEATLPPEKSLAIVAALDETGATAGLVYQREAPAGSWTLKGEAALHLDLAGQLSTGFRVVISR